jgi:hypothetical protein
MSRSATSAETLFEQIATRLGFKHLAERIPWLPNPLICWGVGVFVIDLIVLQAAKELAGYPATFIIDPIWVVQPVLGLLAPFVVVFLHNRYDAVLEEIDIEARTSNSGQFASVAPYSLRVSFYLILTGYALWKFLFDVGLGTITEIGGIAELIGVAVVLPLGYGIIFSEFLATYIGIMLLFPRRIKRSDFRLNFLDPESLGGLRPAGELMKSTYYFLVFGLIGYLVILYGPSIVTPLTGSPYPDPGLIVNILFTVIWLISIATMIYGLSQVHWFMKRTKREELSRLDRELRDSVKDPFDMETFEISDKETYEETRQRIEYVNSTQEYPTTFTMWIQILIGLLLPKAIQLALAYL